MYIFFLLLQLAPFDPTKKKKKKKVVIQEPSDEVDKLAEKTETLAVTEPAELNFTGMKKKKKKQVRQIDLELIWTMLKNQKMNRGFTFIHSGKFQVDLESSIADLGDGEDTQGAFYLLLI